jgi:potassium/hydrogen antiporter
VEMCRHPGFHVLPLLWSLVLEMGIGCILGYLCGIILVHLTQRLKMPCEGLYQVLVIAMVLLSYGIAAVLGGSGFLAVYITGIVFGNARSVEREKYVPIYDAIAWLMQISMFLVLGLLAFPKQLPPVMSTGFILALFLCFVARPFSVFLSLALSKMSWKEKLLISWVGLRGAVPIILATYPLINSLPEAWTYFHIIFFIVLSSVLLQGLSIPWLAKKLNLQA